MIKRGKTSASWSDLKEHKSKIACYEMKNTPSQKWCKQCWELRKIFRQKVWQKVTFNFHRFCQTLTGPVSKTTSVKYCLNTPRPRQNGHHFPDDIFKCIFLNEKIFISIKISQKFIPNGPINNIPALVQIMTWCQSGKKPLSESMMAYFTNAYMRHLAELISETKAPYNVKVQAQAAGGLLWYHEFEASHWISAELQPTWLPQIFRVCKFS